MTTEGATSITYDGEANEIAAAKTIEVDFTGYKAPEIIKENEDVTVYTSDTTEEKKNASPCDSTDCQVSVVSQGDAYPFSLGKIGR
jgi:hypothetical protein